MEALFVTSPSEKSSTEQPITRNRAQQIRRQFPYQRGAKVSR
jgi:hypothetical protein